MYKHILKKIFFLFDPEKVHDHMVQVGKFLGKFSFTRKLTRSFFVFEDPSLVQTIQGITFKNPIGLSAGFDKNAELTDILPEVGFGFVELGSITAKACPGNSKPRLWRLPRSKSLAVYYGLKNDGCKVIHNRLKQKNLKIPVGISIAKTNCAETVDIVSGVKDYVESYITMSDIGAYDTINISCPNAYGGQPFTDKKSLNLLLLELTKHRNRKPLFLKISPDLSLAQVEDILELVVYYKVDGVICSNLTKNRTNKKILDHNIPDQGGLSGKVVDEMSNNHISLIYRKTQGKLCIIGVGGVFSAQDAYKKIRLGASLVQLITGMIYEGPQLIGKINQDLVDLLTRDGFKNISEAVGADNFSLDL